MFALESVNAALERRDAKTLLKCLRLPHLGLRDIKDDSAEFYLNRLTEIREYKQVGARYIPQKSVLHVPTPSQFSTTSMATGQNGSGTPPHPASWLAVVVDTILLNFDGHCDGDWNGFDRCKQTLDHTTAAIGSW